MKKITCFLFFVLTNLTLFSQLDSLDLKNALVVAQLDKAEDRFTLEVNLTEILTNCGIKTMASLNAMKQGADPLLIAGDSMQQVMEAKGFDTYLLVSVRGYDTKFKPAKNFNDLKTEMTVGHLFPLYRDEIVSVTLEFHFYRNGKHVAYDIMKLPGTSSRDLVIKKLRKKITEAHSKSVEISTFKH